MKTFLFSTTLGIATLLATNLSASACHHRGCAQPYYPQFIQMAPQTPTSPNPGGNNNGQPTNPSVNNGQTTNSSVNNGQTTNSSVNNGQTTKPGANNPRPSNGSGQSSTGTGPAIEWDLPAEEKARIRAAAKSAATTIPDGIPTSSRGGRR